MDLTPQHLYLLSQAAANTNGSASFDRRYERGLEELVTMANELLSLGYLDEVTTHESSRDDLTDKVVIQISELGRQALKE